ncbi:piercer of microtubule wall 2 protein [Halichoeres trimaculatus]|uniref:piercer of microtubule wall 2 protein n=1 Tax=Halichoeres trimaculatus TaxID=147232 RepID=UPI003D9EBA90
MEDHGVKTCDFYRTDPNLPHRFNNPDSFKGYSQKKSNPLYRTSNQTYGSKKPTVHEMQTKFAGTSRQFSEAMLQTGMYRDNGLNTALDKSVVTVSTETLRNRNEKRYFNQLMKQDGEK